VHALAKHQPVTGAQAVATTPGDPDLQREIIDLPSEITWLVRVATAYTHSPLVAALAAQEEQQRGADRRLGQQSDA
jgi:hypothetical protein